MYGRGRGRDFSGRSRSREGIGSKGRGSVQDLFGARCPLASLSFSMLREGDLANLPFLVSVVDAAGRVRDSAGLGKSSSLKK